jgi:hypothetical protein
MPDRADNLVPAAGAASEARQRAIAARSAFSAVAEHLVTSVGGPVQRFAPGSRLTTFAEWFTTVDNGTLLVAVNRAEPMRNVAEAIAYAVSWQHDRDLALFLPAVAVPAATYRLAFLETPVRVWTFDEQQTPVPHVIPTRDEAMTAAGCLPLRRSEQHDLGEYEPLVSDLIRAARHHWALAPAHRGSYLAWHCGGRQVLRVARARDGVRIDAGVQYKNPPADRLPFMGLVTAALTDVQRAQVEATVATAVADRFTGRDEAHVEHQMQAALAASELSGFGFDVVGFTREYPAWRGDSQGGFIDFLAVDTRGHLHVIETKIGPDPMLVFQALDYATWVRAHAAEIRADLGWQDGDNSVVHIDFVVAPKARQPAIGSYTAGQLEALTGDISWRIHVSANARAVTDHIVSSPRRTMPAPEIGVIAEPVMPPRFAGRLQAELKKS